MAKVSLVIDGDPTGFKKATRDAVDAMDQLQRSGTALTESTTKNTAAAERYIEALKREAIALGAGEQALRRYEMMQLGLSAGAQRQAEHLHAAIDAQKKAEDQLKRTGDAAERVGRQVGSALNALAASAVAAWGVIQKGAIEQVTQFEQSTIRMMSTLRASNYAAGRSFADLEAQIKRFSQITIFDDEQVREAAAALLRFRDISGEAFDTALRLSLDMAASMGTDAVSGARKMGAAMQDGERAIRAMGDAGKNLSTIQRKLIKDLIESGDHLGAMRVMAQAAEGSFGGLAEALNTGMRKSTTDLKKAWDDMLESLGRSESVGGKISRIFRASADAIRDIDDLMRRGAGDSLARAAGFFMHLAGGTLTQRGMGYLGVPLQDAAARVGASSYRVDGLRASGVINRPSEAAVGALQQQIDRAQEKAAADLKKALEEAAKASEKARAEYERTVASAERWVSALEDEVATLGMSTAEKKAYQAEQVVMTLRTKEEQEALRKKLGPLLEALDLEEKRVAAAKRAAADSQEILRIEKERQRELDRSVEAAKRELEGVQRSNEEFGKSRAAIEEATLAKLEGVLANKDFADSTYQEIAALEARIEIQKRIVSAARMGEELRNQARLVDDASSKFAQLGSTAVRAALDGENAVKALTNELKNLLVELAALTMKKWFIEIAAGFTGNSAVGAMAGQMGQGTLTGAFSQALGGWATRAFGSSAIGSGSLLGEFGVGLKDGLVPGMGAWGQFGAALKGAAGLLGYFAIAIAGAAVAAHQYASGWRLSGANNTSTSPGGIFSGGESGIPGATWMASAMDRTYRALGFNDQWAAILSGSSMAQRIFGRRSRQNDAFGFQGSFGPGGVTGNTWQDWSEQGGWFTNTRRGTVSSPFSAQQQNFMSGMMGGVTAIVEGLARRLGVDPARALAGYHRDFNVQLTENGEPLSDERMREVFNELFVGVLQDQVTRVLREGGQGDWADYVASLKGSSDDIATRIQNVMDFLSALDDLDTAISVLEGTTTAAQEAIKGMNKRVDDAQVAWEKALASGDPGELLAAEQELTSAIMDRYNQEMEAVLSLERAIDDLKQAAYEFQVSMAQRIINAGGTADIAGMSWNRAMDLRGQVGGSSRPDRQLRLVNQFVGSIDAWYNARRGQIERDIAAQERAAQAAIAAQQAAYQARIAGLQAEIQLTQQWAGIVGQTKELIDSMRFSAINPLPITGRYALAAEQAAGLGQAFNSATGAARVDAASRYVTALQAQVAMLGDVYQRPSAEYQREYNRIIAELTRVQAEAQTEAEKVLNLQRELVRLQDAANALGQAQVDLSSYANSQLELLNEQYIAQIQWAQTEGERLYNLQVTNNEDLLKAITGGKPVEIFMAERQAEMVDLLRDIRDDGRAARPAVGPGSDPDDGTTPAGTTTSTGGSRGGTTANVVSKHVIDLQAGGRSLKEFTLEVIEKNGTRVARILDKA